MAVALLRAVLGEAASLATAEHPGTHEAQQRGQERHGRGHSQHDSEDGGESQTVEEVQAEDQQPE